MDAATALIVAFILSVYYSGMETAFTAFDRILISGWIRRRRIGSRTARFLSARPARFLNTALIGTNISNVALSTLVVVLVEASDIHTAWAVVGTPFVILIFAELLPKMFGYSLANLAVRWTSLPLLISYYVFAPLRALYTPVTRPLAGSDAPTGIPWKRQDLDQILIGAEAEGAVSPEEGVLLTRYLDARELKVRQIMTPRTQLVAVSRNTPPDEVRELFRTTRYNIIPVYEGDLDHVIGHVSAKQFLDPSRSLDDLIRPLHAVPESKRIVELLHEFKTEHHQAALVIDEHGGTDGFVTLQDILEELIGPVAERIDPSQPVIKRIAAGKYLVSGSACLDDIEQVSGWKPPKTEAITLSGLLAETLGRIANAGEEIEFDKVMVRIIRRTPRHVEACLVKIEPTASAEAEDRG